MHNQEDLRSRLNGLAADVDALATETGASGKPWSARYAARALNTELWVVRALMKHASRHDRDTMAAIPSSDSDTAMLAASPVDKGADAAGPNCSQAKLPNPMNTQNRPTFDPDRRLRVAAFSAVLSALSAVVSVLGVFMPDSIFHTIVITKVMSITTAMTLFAAALTFSAIHITRS